MKIGIIGTGNVGMVLGLRWADSGNEVVFGSRRADSDDWQAIKERHNIDIASPADAAAFGDVVVLAVPWSVTEKVIEGLGDLSGKIVLDCTNPLGPNFTMDLTGTSGGEHVAEWAKGAKVVKALNTTGSKNMGDPVYDEQPLAMLVCGDDVEAKANVMLLTAELGFDPVDAGPLSKSKYLEAMAYVWISQAYQEEWGADFGFAVLRR